MAPHRGGCSRALLVCLAAPALRQAPWPSPPQWTPPRTFAVACQGAWAPGLSPWRAVRAHAAARWGTWDLAMSPHAPAGTFMTASQHAPAQFPRAAALLAVAAKAPSGRQDHGARKEPCESHAETAGSANAHLPRPAQAPVVFEHLDPECPLMYGVGMPDEKAPLVFLTTPRCEELAAYIRDDPSGPFARNLAWPKELSSTPPESWKNEREAPFAPGHWAEFDFQFSEKEPFLLKADWHGVHGWGSSFDVFVPRKYSTAPCQRCPPRLLAFLEAFREVNRDCWRAIEEGLEALKAKGTNDFDRQRLLDLLLESFSESGHFAAVEVQAGPAHLNENMRWHMDGATGLLHLGITLGGSRKVEFSTDGKNCDAYMAVGGFYVSSPFLYDHRVTYYEAKDETGPVLALMCRFGFLDEKHALWANHLYGPDMLEVADLIASSLRDAVDRSSLRLPSLGEVAALEARQSAPRPDGASS
mmetsp:Transcript_57835/g.161430  ORF Transcript_57835/g.161430 Transcript_57835/m.161430 type:complete len:472 (+) Transcript_57835:47-1462(+)